jgi:hypothetical protein
LEQAASDLAAVMAPVLRTTVGGVWDRMRSRAVEQTGDAAEGWLRSIVLHLFVRHADGRSVDERGPVPDDAVIDAEVVETLDDVAADPENRAARRLLARLVAEAVAMDVDPAGVLRALLEAAPAGLGGQFGSGNVDQRGNSGVAIAVPGTIIGGVHVVGLLPSAEHPSGGVPPDGLGPSALPGPERASGGVPPDGRPSGVLPGGVSPDGQDPDALPGPERPAGVVPPARRNDDR